jgi:uncharacterized protein YciI
MPVAAPQAAVSSGATRRPQFLIRLFPHRGVALLTNPSPEERTIMAAHRNYVEVLANRGHLILAGLSDDTNIEGLVIIEADSEDEARGLMVNDPFVLGDLVRAELRPFRTVLARA